jgi:DNA-binding NarL/FixJ family response regulator
LPINSRLLVAPLAPYGACEYWCDVGIRLVLAEDNLHMADALEAVLAQQPDIQVVAVARGGADAVRFADELAPDVMVLDRAMPEIDGITAMRQIKRRHPELPVLILTASAEAQVAESALAAGAAGFVAKDSAFDELATAIRTVFKKKVYLSPRLARRLVT